MNPNDDFYKSEKKLLLIVYIIMITILCAVIIDLAISIFQFSSNENNHQISYIEIGNITDMNMTYDSNGNPVYEMKVETSTDKELTIVIDKKDFLAYRIGDAVKIKNNSLYK